MPSIVKQNRQDVDRVTHEPAGKVDTTAKPLTIPLVNYALNRPAMQSSLTIWSRGKTLKQEARRGNNGNLLQECGCHTGEEDRPWWQVDLGRETAIDSVVIYNRQKCAYRLRYFSLLASHDAQEWKRFYKRTSSEVFGEAADDKLVIFPEYIVIARFVRLRLDYRESLHFRECEVYGRLPTPQDYQLLEAQDNVVARQEALIAGRIGFIQKIGEHSVFVDEVRYGAKVVRALQLADYEQDERHLTDKAVLPSDRILEVGMGLGVVSMVAADRTSPEQVRTFDGNPYIVEDAKKNFAFNQIAGIEAAVGVLKNRRHFKRYEKTLKFSVLKDFWASHKGESPPGPHLVEIVDVPIFCLEDQIAAHRANVLIIDIEGGEIDLLSHAKLSPIRLIIMETHYRVAGVEATDNMIRQLMAQGFNINLSLSRAGVVVLRRDLEKRRNALLRKLFSRFLGLHSPGRNRPASGHSCRPQEDATRKASDR